MSTRTEWIIFGVGFALAVPLWLWRGELPHPGAPRQVNLTLLTSDREDLSCALDGEYGGFRCGFGADGKPIEPAVPPERTLSPYMNERRELFLIPNLFAQEALRARYESESPTKISRSRLKRFTAECNVRLVQKLEGVQVRWLRRGTFSKMDAAWVAEAQHCAVK
jgi:hypothetical protein